MRIIHILLFMTVLIYGSDSSFIRQANLGGAVAIPMTYHVMKNRQKFIALCGYSDTITYVKATSNGESTDFGIRYRDAIIEWNIHSIPAHGTLYDGRIAVDSVPYTVSDPDELLYVPDGDYVGNDAFTFFVQDNNGISYTAMISLIVENTPSVPAGMAEFPAIFNTPAPLPSLSGDTQNDDWYVDNSNPNATDEPRMGESDPRHGTPDTPRATLPPNYATFSAGAAVFIFGGVSKPYHLRNSGWHRWIAAGAAEAPVYILGVNNGSDKPIIDHNFDTRDKGTQLRLEMEYTIIEGLHFHGAKLVQRDELESYTNGNIVLRHCLIDGLNKGTVGTSMSMNIGDTKVLYDVHIKNTGYTEPDLSEENDVHGVQISNVTDYWILDSLIHDSAGDAIQINAEFASNIYIGRNKLHSDNENALDFKRRYDLMFMENDVWDYRAISYDVSGSDGTPVIINQDTSGQSPHYSTIARNRIWDANAAVRLQGEYIWVSDNLFWNIHANSGSVSYAVTVGNNDESNYHERITNNIFEKFDGGIWNWASNNSGVKEHIYSGNIFGDFNADSAEKAHYRISSNHTAGTHTSHNIYKTPLKMMWGTSNVDNMWDMTEYRTNTSNATGSLDGVDPLFVDSNLFNLRLQPASPAIGANIEQPTYAEFYAQYNRSIAFDADLNARPRNGTWDIGAYEAASMSATSTSTMLYLLIF